jgi:hypothetical protein
VENYGQVTLTCDVNEAHSFQARLPTIHPRSSPTSTPTTLTDATLQALSAHSLSGNSPTCRQTAPPARDQPRNNLGRHLAATGAPSGDGRMDHSGRQGEPPTHMEFGAPPIGKMGASHNQGAGPALNVSRAPSMNLLHQAGEAPPNQSELGVSSASQLGRPRQFHQTRKNLGAHPNVRD